jgi:hypothetical protein
MSLAKRYALFWFALFTFVWSEEAHAYLDPGSGSIIVQSIVAAIAVGLFMIKVFWQKITNLFSGKKGTQPDPKSEQNNK